MIPVPAWVLNVNLKKKLLKNQNVEKDQKFFVITSFLKTTLLIKFLKFWENKTFNLCMTLILTLI